MTDRIQFMGIEADRNGWRLTVQMESGSFSQQFLPVDEVPDVVFRLRRLAELIDSGTEKDARAPVSRPEEP